MLLPVPTITARNTRPRRRAAAIPSRSTTPAPDETSTACTGREAVSAAKLLAFINHAMEARPECAGVKVRAGDWTLDPYADDCNWSETSLLVHVAGVVGARAFQELRKVIGMARQRYDVLAPEAYLL